MGSGSSIDDYVEEERKLYFNNLLHIHQHTFFKYMIQSVIEGKIRRQICVFKKVKLINHDCLPILMLLYIMLYIVLAYLMLFAALTNAVCLYNASFFAIDFCKCFLFSCFVFVY